MLRKNLTPDERASLDPRVAPTKENGKRTMEQLLATGAQLLDKVGFEGFNTNLLAETAGVRIRTVYRYFPNKFAIITTIARRMSDEWAESYEPSFLRLEDPKAALRPVLESLLNGFIKHTSEQVGAIAILQAIASSPALRELDREVFERISKRMAYALTNRGLDLPAVRMQALSSVLTISAFAAVDLYVRMEDRREARAMWSALVDMHVSTLERFEK